MRHLLYLKKQNSITETFYDKVLPHGSAPARLYGLPKVHKANHPHRPICSSLKSYNYNLAAELSRILSPFSTNTYTVKNTFSFVDEIQSLQYDSSFICSFDVSSSFTNIPLDETIEIALDYAFENNDKVNGLNRKQFKKLLRLATKEIHFIFNGNAYDQIDGVAMGSPLAPVLANIFMKHFEEKALDKFVFENQADVQPFFDYLNSLHTNIQFTKEVESPDVSGFPFLDVFVTRMRTDSIPVLTTNRLTQVSSRTGTVTHPGNIKSI